MTTQKHILLLPGDGIGPEVVAETKKIIDFFGFSTSEGLLGGAAYDAVGTPFPDETVAAAKKADAVLLGAVGGPPGHRWSDPMAKVRPEQGLLRLRQHFGLYANLRPVKALPALVDRSPLRPELLTNVDILFIRELTGGLYFGPRQEQGEGDTAYDTMLYSAKEIERVVELAFQTAQKRRKFLTSVDKANVLASMRLWRRIVEQVGKRYPDVKLEHQLVDSFAMLMIKNPSRYDVVVAENMFGDILTDEAAVLSSSLGMLPSASLGVGTMGVYEPIHGSAPDIAGKGIANPTGTILSAALLLRYSLGLEAEAVAIETAVEKVINDGARTGDVAAAGETALGSAEYAAKIKAALV
jgi:3-isopropylmalate dehydrogenase